MGKQKRTFKLQRLKKFYIHHDQNSKNKKKKGKKEGTNERRKERRREGRRERRDGEAGEKGEQSNYFKSMPLGLTSALACASAFWKESYKMLQRSGILCCQCMLNTPMNLDSEDPCLFLASSGFRSYLASYLPHFLGKAT